MSSVLHRLFEGQGAKIQHVLATEECTLVRIFGTQDGIMF